MQVMWMVLVTLGLALGGILGLALLAHLDARTSTGEPSANEGVPPLSRR